jgi:hypothetical protein
VQIAKCACGGSVAVDEQGGMGVRVLPSSDETLRKASESDSSIGKETGSYIMAFMAGEQAV